MPAPTDVNIPAPSTLAMPSPGLPPFDYLCPDDPDEVVALLLQHGRSARLLMGGTDLFVQMRDGALAPRVVIDVKRLPGMRELSFDPADGLHVGAAVNMNALAAAPAVQQFYPLLAQAVASVASYQLRTRATMGGNLCNGSPAADTAPAALVLDAQCVVWGPDGERTIPANNFFLGVRKTALQPGEFLTRMEFPVPPTGYAGRYIKLGRNAGGDLAIVGVAVLGYPETSAASGYRFRFALASVAPTPIRVPEAEALLAEQPITSGLLSQAALAAEDAATPINDLRGSARYRKAMVRNLTRRALDDVWNQLQAEG
ncbi:MAG: xanthine dehydrogenase family protein subunit M [Chloroflexi bacterium]|nr:xanthine dehydrogenase family protein subunit M [Chloroflexota bacterium]